MSGAGCWCSPCAAFPCDVDIPSVWTRPFFCERKEAQNAPFTHIARDCLHSASTVTVSCRTTKEGTEDAKADTATSSAGTLSLKPKSGAKAFCGRGQRYRRLAAQHRVGSCCLPDTTGRTVSVLSLMDKTSRSASVRVDRWHTGGALHLTKPCRNATGILGLGTPQESIAIFGTEIFCRALLLLLG